MKTARTILYALIFLLPSLAGARDISLPDTVEAKAFVLEAAKDALWEKTLVVQFPQRRRILSTNDGATDVMAAVNHAAHPLLWSRADETMKNDHQSGGMVYMLRMREKIAAGLGLRGSDVSMMGTAADMNNLAVITKTFGPFTVTALVTAGAKGNAIRTGVDEGTYIETDPASEKGPTAAGLVPPGTVNIMILTNARLTDGAMARAIITATEGKTAAFEDLHVQSSYHPGVQATGTGTDSMIVVSGLSGLRVTYTGGHSKIGELIGKAVYEAVVEALGKQNGFKKAS
jgi:adenosylcobinamide hydrolase